MSKRKKGYLIFLWMFLLLSISGFFGAFYYYFYRNIPNTYKLPVSKEETIHFALPVSAEVYKESIETMGTNNVIKTTPAGSITLKADRLESYHMDLKLFGTIPVKTIDLEVVNDIKVYPVGEPIGIYVKTQGVLVIGVGDVENVNKMTYSPCANIINEGDYIQAVNNEEVSGKKDLIEKVKSCNGKDLIITLRRDDEAVKVKVKPVLDKSGDYKIGLWIRDSAQGIGTLTFVDEEGKFGALGHGINDVDTSELMEIENGGVYKADIVSIRKGENGNPGELTGVIDYGMENKLGIISKNTDVGIYGTLSKEETNSLTKGAIPIGLKQEVHEGKAFILCEIDGESKFYDVEITEINLDNDNTNRGIVLKITDENLINLTGGIVQGMSGAPIIQDGKLIGAVTHVFVRDATKGYGVFIENMVLMR
ncbi:MAG: SpoIVB peptidase [Lachnospiraceae bacterium]|nr:SpoIVB peptidase [Lachnospiraceae bacterium]